MATRQRMTVYRTNGNAAYAPAYTGGAAPRREDEQYQLPKRAPRRQAAARPQVEVRPAGQIAPFAVFGFLAVGLVAALLLISTLQVHMASDEVVTLKSELAALQTEQEILTAQYEQAFDVEHLQAAIGSEMTRPTADQITYIDMSEPDSVVLYAKSPVVPGAAGAVAGIREVFSGLVEYFH